MVYTFVKDRDVLEVRAPVSRISTLTEEFTAFGYRRRFDVPRFSVTPSYWEAMEEADDEYEAGLRGEGPAVGEPWADGGKHY